MDKVDIFTITLKMQMISVSLEFSSKFSRLRVLTHYERSGAAWSEAAGSIAERNGEVFTCKRSRAARLIISYGGFCPFLLLGGVKHKRKYWVHPIKSEKENYGELHYQF